MNDIVFASIKKARMEVEKETISENMMGLDFSTLLCECNVVTRAIYLAEDFGTTEMEFKKGEW
jgi:hypothetical protein